MINPWQYQCDIVYIVDGDTVDTVIDLGFNVRIERRVRLSGVDTAEIYGVSHDSEEYERGKVHQRFVKSWANDARSRYDGDYPFFVETSKIGKYGRYAGTITRKDTQERLKTALVDEFGDEVTE